MSTADNLSTIRSALQSGFASPTYVTSRELEAARGGDVASYARLLGQSLGERAQMLWSASVGEYKASARSYDELAARINAEFSANLAVLTTDGDAFGIRD